VKTQNAKTKVALVIHVIVMQTNSVNSYIQYYLSL